MTYDANKAILESARIFDIHSQESELQAQEDVDWISGDVEETPADDVDVPDTLPLENAIEIQQVSKSPVFQNIFAALKTLHAECVTKSKDEKQTADFRSLNHTKGLGVEQAIGIFTAMLEESESRLKSATPEERRAMGADANTFISDLITPSEPIIVGPSSLETPKSPSVPSAGVQRNTRAAQKWLAKN
jgi:hypothetical protein